MAKQSYYFSHDYNPIGDPKMQAMVSEYGGLGYGIFWRIVEMLHAESDHKLPLKKYMYCAVANQMKSTPEFVGKFIDECVAIYELFRKDGEFITSSRVIRNIEDKEVKMNRKSEIARMAGIKSGESRRYKKDRTNVELNRTNVHDNEQTLTFVEQNEQKERKGKEIKGNIIGSGEYGEIHKPMTSEDFINFQSKLIQEQIFTDQIMSTRGIATKVELLNWIKYFNCHISGEGKLNKDYGEYKRHFKNWIMQQDTAKPAPISNGLSQQIKPKDAYQIIKERGY